jgi:hypothetical protein
MLGDECLDGVDALVIDVILAGLLDHLVHLFLGDDLGLNGVDVGEVAVGRVVLVMEMDGAGDCRRRLGWADANLVYLLEYAPAWRV